MSSALVGVEVPLVLEDEDIVRKLTRQRDWWFVARRRRATDGFEGEKKARVTLNDVHVIIELVIGPDEMGNQKLNGNHACKGRRRLRHIRTQPGLPAFSPLLQLTFPFSS
jgi:hypothetical protein